MSFDLCQLELGDVIGIVIDDENTTVVLTIVAILTEDQCVIGERLSGRRYYLAGQVQPDGSIDPSIIAPGEHRLHTEDGFNLVYTVKAFWLLKHYEPRPDKDAKEKRGRPIFPCR